MVQDETNICKGPIGLVVAASVEQLVRQLSDLSLEEPDKKTGELCSVSPGQPDGVMESGSEM